MTSTSAGHRLLTVTSALLAALALCLLTESGIARMIGPGVLSPFSAGRFLPGRMAREGAMVVLCLALALTERGQRLRARLTAALEKDRYCWLAGLAVTALFFLWACRVTVICFMTNDDTAIMRTIGRIPTQGLASADHTFSHILFCALLGFFYRLAPGGYWYAWYHLATIFASLTVIGRCVFLKAGKRGWPFGAGALIHLSLCSGLFLLTIARLAFTVTPAVAGSAAVALSLCRSDTASRAGHICTDAVGVLLMLLCFLQRSATGKCLFCFWALATGYGLLRLLPGRRPERWKRLIPPVVCAAVTAGLLWAVNGMGASDLDQAAAPDPDYSRAEYYRSIVMDYLMPELTDEQFEAAGLPRELVTLLRDWYFMDERVNTDTFKKLTDLYYTAEEQTGHTPTLRDALMNSEDAANRAHMLRFTVAAALLLLLAAVNAVRFGRRYWPELLCALGAAGGGVILCVYLLREGRFPLRVFLVVAIPAIVTLLLMAIAAPAGLAGPAEKRRPALTGLWALLCTGLAAVCVLSVHAMPDAASDATRADVFAKQYATENYANAHPDITFVTNFLSNNLDPFHDPLTYPSNMGLWGGTGVTASSDRLYADAFFRDDIQFMYEQSSTIIPFLQYLTLDYGPVQAVSVAKLTQNVSVADMDQVTPGADYTGWYEHNGMTYYFRRGQALSGEQVIDGTAYTFAPVGAQAQLVVVPGPAGLIYTTDAYSLVSPEP